MRFRSILEYLHLQRNFGSCGTGLHKVQLFQWIDNFQSPTCFYFSPRSTIINHIINKSLKHHHTPGKIVIFLQIIGVHMYTIQRTKGEICNMVDTRTRIRLERMLDYRPRCCWSHTSTFRLSLAKSIDWICIISRYWPSNTAKRPKIIASR